jgi:hypothetical protein
VAIKCEHMDPFGKRRRPAHVLLAFASLGIAASSPGQQAPAAQSPILAAPVMMGVRVLKAPGAPRLGWKALPPATCRNCTVLLGPRDSGQNEREIFFHVLMPSGSATLEGLRLQIDPASIRAVLASVTDYDLPKRGFVRPEPRTPGIARVRYDRTKDGIVLHRPPRWDGPDLPPDDLGDITENYTFIETPGLYVRVAHADPTRRRGGYASGRWPAVEIAAALNLEFAAREAIKELGLVEAAQRQGVQTIMLMNFDTNYPTLAPNSAHDDWPPHWHMHLLWRDQPKIRKVGHFFITPDGLLSQNQSGDLASLKSQDRVNRWYEAGEPDETRTPEGDLVYAHTITGAGQLILSTRRGTCRFSPVAGGFDSGVNLTCDPGHRNVRVKATDDPLHGTLDLFVDDRKSESYRYDVDTGAILDGTPDNRRHPRVGHN